MSHQLTHCRLCLCLVAPVQGSGLLGRLGAFFVGVGVGGAAGTYYLVLPALNHSTTAIVAAVEASSTCK